MAGLIFGGFSYAKQEIQNHLTASMTTDLRNTANNGITVNVDNSIVSSGDCQNLKIDHYESNTYISINSAITHAALVTMVNKNDFEDKIKNAIEQTMQNVSVSPSAMISKSKTINTTSIQNSFKSVLSSQQTVDVAINNRVLCNTGNVDIKFMKNSSVVDIIADLVQKATTNNQVINDVAQDIAAESKQTQKDAILGILLVTVVAMVLFFGGPAILGMVVVGESTGFVFNTLTKTPSTKMLLVAIVFLLVLWYISSDCGGNFPIWRFELPPAFVRKIVPIPRLVTLDILPSFCTYTKTQAVRDKDGNVVRDEITGKIKREDVLDEDGNVKRFQYKTRKNVVYGVVTAIFVACMYRLYQEVGADTVQSPPSVQP